MSNILSFCPPLAGFEQLRGVRARRGTEGGGAGDHGTPQVVAARAPEEPLPHQGREDHAGHHHPDDLDSGKTGVM